MLQVTCQSCGTQAFTEDNADPDAALVCVEGSGCCPEDHHHGQAANATGTPCRPVTITVLPGSVTMHRAAQ
jgi:hypothetical protein